MSSSQKKERKTVKSEWNAPEVISAKLRLERKCVSNVINLLEDGATIPFIARYRKDQTGNMEPEVLREVAARVEELRNVQMKIMNVHESITKIGKMSPELETSLVHSTSIMEVETLFAPFKPGHKGSYAERARALGLGGVTADLLKGRNINLSHLVKSGEKGLESVSEVERGVKHIVADIVAKDKDLMDAVRDLCNTCHVLLRSSRAKAKAVKTKLGDKKENKFSKGGEKDLSHKFEQYFDKDIPIKYAKPHQVLALNRGEDQHILTVKVVIPDQVKSGFLGLCLDRLYTSVRRPDLRALVRQAAVDAYDRLVEPMLCRHTRAELTRTAERASVSVFSSNLHSLLLTPPVRQKTILGLDPGFSHGCKFAVISQTGEIVTTGVAYLHRSKMEEKSKLARVINMYQCETVGIGNGTACRETEQIISDMIRGDAFAPLSVVYCIVDECGASIYSVSPQAEKEMPQLDPTMRGAVSIARRLQDPLAELVKIDPKNLGVGMYQHDLNNNSLQAALASVVEECVSFVGVDLNTCSECLLSRVAGLNASKAKKIVEWRSQHGRFTNRQQLLEVKGLGKKGFEQCAGFVRVTRQAAVGSGGSLLKTEVKEEVASKPKAGQKRKLGGKGAAGGSGGKKAKAGEVSEWNPLDSTSVHPESYSLACSLIERLGLDLPDIGKPHFINTVKAKATEDFLREFSTSSAAGESTVRLIAEALQQTLEYDIRDKQQKPMFKREVMSLSDLKVGSALTGRVSNVTHFGAFVDIGVGTDGLIHSSRMGRFGSVHVGDHVDVKVDTLELARRRIGLLLTGIQCK